MNHEQIEKLEESFKKVIKAIIEFREKMIQTIHNIIKYFEKIYLLKILNAPKRLKHLAFHHKKIRVRKKNLRRLWAYA